MAAGRKKATRKKTTVKKAARKKAPAKKAARKKAARKKATRKKATAKKAARKKTTVKKAARKKGAAKKAAPKKTAPKKTAPKKTVRAKAPAKPVGRRAAPKAPAVAQPSGGEPMKSAEQLASAEQPAGAKLAASVPVRIGVVTHYFGRAGAAVISLESGELRVGDTIHVRGHTTDFYQRVGRIEIEHASVEVAKPGQSVGLEVSQRVREHDEVFGVSEPA